METSFGNHGLPENDENVLQSPYANIQLPIGLEERTVRQLKKKNLIVSSYSWYRMKWLKAAAIIIALAGIFMAGLLVGNGFNSRHTIPSNTLKEYLLLLHNPDNFISDDPEHAREYSAWLKSLRKEGLIAEGEELNDKGWTVAMSNTIINMSYQPISSNQGKVSGYFIIKASSEGKALQVASSCPHLKYKGVIEVRPIQQQVN